MLLGARLAMGGGSYPWDYRIAYLETSASIAQWIDFGLYADDASSGLKFNGKCLFNTWNPGVTYGPYLFGGYGSNIAGITCQTRINVGEETFAWMWRYGSSVAYGSYDLQENREYDVESYYSPTLSYLKQDGRTIVSKSSGGSYDHVKVPLFCTWNINAVLERISFIRMIGAWSFEKGGTLYRNLIPCVKDGVVCVYDTVTQQFYYNAGSGSFTAGPRVADDGGV